MSRYNMDINVQGNAQQQLTEIANGLGRISTMARSVGESAGKLVGGIEGGMQALGTQALGTIQMQLDSLRGKMLDAVNTIKSIGMEYGKAIIDDASKFETAQKDIQFAFGKNWEGVYDQVLKDSAQLSFTFEETMQLAAGLGRMKINPFGGDKAEDQLFMARTGEKVRALSVLQDAASASGKDMGGFMFSVREAISGDMKSIADALDLPKPIVKGWKKDIEALKEPQEKYNLLIGKLGEMFGGASALKANTFANAMRQIPDLMQQLRAGVGERGLQTLTKALFEFIDALSTVAKDKEIIAALGAAFDTFAQAAAGVVRIGVKFMLWVADLIKAAPWLPKIASYIVLIGGGLLMMGAMAAGAAISVASLAAAIMAIGWEAIAVGLGFVVALFPIFLALMPLVGGLIVLMSTGSKIVNEGWGGVGTIFDKLKITFTALMELFDSYNGTSATMSLETAQKLKNSGMFDFVMKVMEVFHNLDMAWDEFKATIDEAYMALAPTFIPMLKEIGNLLTELADAFGMTSAATKAGNTDQVDYIQMGRQFAGILIEIAGFLITNIRIIVMFGRMGAAAVHMMLNPFETLERIIDRVITLLYKAKDAVKAVLPGMGAVLDKVMGDKAPAERHEALVKGSLWGGDAKVEAPKRSGIYGNLSGTEADNAMAKDLGMADKKGGYKAEDLNLSEVEKNRLMRGQKLMKREQEGTNLDEGLRMTGNHLELLNKEDALSKGTGRNLAQVGKAVDDQAKVDMASKQMETNEHLKKLIGVMEKKDPSVSIDGKHVATASHNANMSVAGGQ